MFLPRLPCRWFVRFRPLGCLLILWNNVVSISDAIFVVFLASGTFIAMATPAFPPRHEVRLASKPFMEHMFHDVNMCLHPVVFTPADPQCMRVAGDAPQALSMIPTA